jgi:N-hydroxyarylamine O-acetyltransferase
MVSAGRGGYCFEQNRLFGAALLEIGFEVRRVLVRVLWHHPLEAPRPSKSHLTLVVKITDEDWLVDVGFGGSVPDQPLRLVPGHVQDTRHDKYRFMHGVEGLQLQIERDGVWEAAFEMTDGLVADADLEVANWHTSTHPQSWFRSALAVSLCTNEARYGLYNRQFSIRRPSQPVEYRELDDAQFSDVLHQYFKLPYGLKLPPLSVVG